MTCWPFFLWTACAVVFFASSGAATSLCNAAESAGADSGVTELRLVAVTDLDKSSAVAGAKKPTWHALLQHITVRRSAEGGYSVDFGGATRLVTSYGEAGRGAEFSELAWHQGRLLTFDDRSGIIFEVPAAAYASHPAGAGHDVAVLPRLVVLEGDASVAKGQKVEWATVKDGVLHAGSFAKEWTGVDGHDVLHNRTLWVATIDPEGRLLHADWELQYAAMRHALGAGRPGYMILEALEWCSERREWFALPRRVSTLPYDEVADETRGANTAIIASEEFDAVRTFTVGPLTPERGFSSFKFVPGTKCNVAVALKTEECEARGTQASYLSVVDLQDGSLLLEETRLPHDSKFEGLAILHHMDDACRGS